MPRVHKVESSRKDYPEFGIKKGDTYYYWTKRYGGMKKSLTYPDRKQLTSSDFLIQIWDIEDNISSTNCETFDDFEPTIQGFIEELESLRDETQEKLDNMPEQLQYAPTGELLQNRVESIEEMISELENIDYDNNIDKEDYESDEEFEEALKDRIDSINEDIGCIVYNGD